MTIRVLVADDEPAARRGVSLLARRQPDLEVVGECASGEEVVATVEREAPDLLFLDVRMPGMDGFEALRQLSGRTVPLVVFVTAYDRYAIRAFEAHAVDYLLKPVDPDRFRSACERARERLRARQSGPDPERLIELIESLRREHGDTSDEPSTGAPEPTFLVRSADRVRLIPASDVRWVTSARDYVRLHTHAGAYLLRETMKSIGRQLAPFGFVRVHRSTLVRADAVRELRLRPNGKLEIVLPDDTTRPVSSAGRARLSTALGKDL